MDDNEPVSTTIPETTTVDTGADKETAATLNASFDDFWKEEDAKTDGAPAAPGDGAAQETRESKAPKREAASEPEEAVKSSPKEYSDEEIDKLAMTRSDRPEAIEDFKQLKTIIKSERSRAKAESERAAKLERDLAEARQNSWTPEARADYEHAASVRRKFDFSSDPEFQAKFHHPIQATYHSVLNEAVDALPDRAAAIEWARYIAANYTPDTLDKNWWTHSVIDKIPDETDRATVRQSVVNLLKMQKERDTEIQRRTNDKSAYDNWIKERDLSKSQQEMREVMDEIGIQEQNPFIKERLKKDTALAKTKEEREALERHNEEFEKLNGIFQGAMKDLTFNGPRARVRAAIQVARAERLEDEYKTMEKELKGVKAERDQLRAEMDKITGVRRRISHTTGTPPASSSKDKNGSGLSIKDLDVRKSFDKFDWGDGT